ncbi:MAG: DUF4147 domain-containing protein [Acidobacteria bacterium]|nr:DUF4147 domain-containing protein [Acidobacteriota bacterium]
MDARKLVISGLTRISPQVFHHRHSSRRLRLVGAGKAAWGMTRALVETINPEIVAGVLAAPGAPAFKSIESFDAGHPLPTRASLDAARRAGEVVAHASTEETVIVLLSGGASSMLTLPAAGLDLKDKVEAIRVLLGAGVDIRALNCVRKHLSAIKGGRLAARSAAAVVTLAISDVVAPVEDDPAVIGSGPTVGDPTTFAEALEIVSQPEIRRRFPAAALKVLESGVAGLIAESPKPGDARLQHATYHLVGSRRDAMAGAAEAAERLGYRAVVQEAPIVGEARDAAGSHAAWLRGWAKESSAATCAISSGETTVRVTGRGTGGRNQEFALALAEALSSLGRDVAVASVGTDGVDGPTDAAGALVDSTTSARARERGLDAREYLRNNDAHSFFDALGDLVKTGATGTNVGDLQVALIGPSGH